ALDLGATPRQVFWRVTLPYLRPAVLSAAALAFLQSFENFTTTYFAIGAQQTFTIFIANKVRQGVTPAVNAVAFIIVAVTITVALVVEVRRRRALARAEEAARLAQIADVEMAAAPNLPAGSLAPAGT
ncbi:MAG: ABC transporter permease, partial [Geminicoccaceae bacterium]